MARMFPCSNPDRQPDSEKRVAELLRALDDSWDVFQSVIWQGPRGGRQSDGEADFVLVHPRHGVLVLEVKGGGVTANGEWRTVDRRGDVHSIKDPFRQAQDSKHALIRYFRQLQKPITPEPMVGHGVVLPDILVGNESIGLIPREMVLDRHDLRDVPSAIERLLSCQKQLNTSKLTKAHLDMLRTRLVPTLTAKRLLKAELAEAHSELLDLTKRQVEVLRLLRHSRRCAVRGGAGTGKTVLAVEKARQMAADGARVLLTCFNAPLGEKLVGDLAQERGIDAGTFHTVCFRAAKKLGRKMPNDLDDVWWESGAPSLLADIAGDAAFTYDAIVIDEAQDFADTWLVALQLLLTRPDESPLYLFADSHQQLYRKGSLALPKEFTVAELDLNCRNTRPIASVVSRVFGDAEPKEGAHGPAPQFMEADDGALLPVVQSVVHRLLADEGLRADQVTVLTDARPNASRLCELTVGSACFVALGKGKGVEVETIHRFKGLEAEAVVLALSGQTATLMSRELLYVAASRARSLLIVVGPRPVGRLLSLVS